MHIAPGPTVPSPPPEPSPPEFHSELLEMTIHHPGPRATVLRVAGEIDMLSADVLQQRITELLDERPDLVLDLSEIRFLGSSGLRVLMSSHEQAEARYGQLHVVTGTHRIVARAITVTAMDRVLRVHPDLDSAIAALPTNQV